MTFDLYAYHGHTQSPAAGAKCKASSLNDVSLSVLCQGVETEWPSWSQWTAMHVYQHRLTQLRSRKPVLLGLPYTTHNCKRYQLRMHAISRSKHTKFKNTKFYSKDVLVNHTKINTNENFPPYGIQKLRAFMEVFWDLKIGKYVEYLTHASSEQIKGWVLFSLTSTAGTNFTCSLGWCSPVDK